MDVTLNVYSFFGIQFFASGLSIISLVYYPYPETKGILAIYMSFCLSYTLFFLYSLIKFRRERIEEFVSNINISPHLYLLGGMQLFPLILMVGNDKFTDDGNVQLCNILYFIINIFYIIVLHLSFSTLKRIEIEPEFKDIVKGREVKPDDNFECPICLSNELKTVIKLRCDHFFHLDCLKESYQNKHQNCGLCRESFV